MQSTKNCLVATATSMLLVLLIGCSFEPDETQIRRFFETKKPLLERLVEMSNQDYAPTKVTSIAHNYTRLEDDMSCSHPESEVGISVARWNEYRKLFADAGLRYGLDRDGEASGEVYFPLWGEGLADNSSEKGVMFSPAVPSNVQGESQRILYKPLTGNWYYFERARW